MKTTDDLTYAIRGAIYRVHAELGPGLLESVYEAALLYELREAGLKVESQMSIPVTYKSTSLEIGFRLDILVENKVILEIKSVENLLNVHKKQLLTYLKLANKAIGFLINFNSDSLIDRKTLIRIVN
ncbi:GxxExxY protein [Echinicola shivajiensis]|uniref:GxxExxY protein n=1 Tax=Echinicola shivajiensis TaxID=1035916 RepID=UPI001BFC85B5|nr:GxxExxY protein [Echinicola shivajiensis]